MTEKTKSPFDINAESILAKGLEAMTRTCDALTKQNEILNEDIKNLKAKIDQLQHRILSNQLERE